MIHEHMTLPERLLVVVGVVFLSALAGVADRLDRRDRRRRTHLWSVAEWLNSRGGGVT